MTTKSIALALHSGTTRGYKWLLGLVMVTVIALGWKYPLLGFIVPLTMIAGIVGSLTRGRWVCGNACPRGSFLDTWLNLVSPRREIPAILRSQTVRWLALIALISLMVFRLAQNPASAAHWGFVFWQMCLLTTLVALGLGLRYASRSWCSICPVGTMASSIGGKKYPLQIHASCKECGICEQKCPMQLDIVRHKDAGKLRDKDCLKCSTCIGVCPGDKVLSWPDKDAA